jgi:hypothetical protein
VYYTGWTRLEMACCVAQYSYFAKAAPSNTSYILAVQRSKAVYPHHGLYGWVWGYSVVPLILKLHGDKHVISFTVIRKVRRSCTNCCRFPNVQQQCVISGLLHGVNKIFGVLGCYAVAVDGLCSGAGSPPCIALGQPYFLPLLPTPESSTLH